MKKLISLILFMVAASAQVSRTPIAIGYMGGGFGASNFTLNSATAAAAYSIIGNGKTLTGIRLNLSAINGTVNGSNVQVSLCGDTNAAPNATCDNTTTLASGTISAGVKDFTVSKALTFGTTYWVVVKNLNSTPTTNYPTIRAITNSTGQWNGTDVRTHGWRFRTTTDGSTWTVTPLADASGMRFAYSDSTYSGLMLTSQTGPMKAYGGTSVGALIAAPASGTILGLSFYIVKTGTPTGTLSYSIYAGSSTTPLATTYSIPLGEVYTSGAMIPLYFSSPVTVVEGTSYHVVISNSAADSSSNCYSLYTGAMDTDVASLALRPMGIQATSFDGTTRTDNPNALAAPVLLYATVTSTTTGSGGGTIAY